MKMIWCKLSKYLLPEAQETLGVMQAPSGAEDVEVDYLDAKIKKLIGKTRSSALQRQDFTQAVNMTIMRTLRYGLIATAMDLQQCTDLTKHLIWGFLPNMGIVRTTSTV